MSDMIADVRHRSRFFEGGNGIALVAVPGIAILCLVFYTHVSTYVASWNIKIEDVYVYVFNIFAIEFGALLALFALFACRPTAFLERIKNTEAFHSIMLTTKITMAVVTAVICLTFVFGLIRLEPEHTLTLHSVLFLSWAALAMVATCFYVRTVRLIFLALA